MTIKAKWEKFHLGNSNVYTWVFDHGKMFVIGGTGTLKSTPEKLKTSEINENTFAMKEKEIVS